MNHSKISPGWLNKSDDTNAKNHSKVSPGWLSKSDDSWSANVFQTHKLNKYRNIAGPSVSIKPNLDALAHVGVVRCICVAKGEDQELPWIFFNRFRGWQLEPTSVGDHPVSQKCGLAGGDKLEAFSHYGAEAQDTILCHGGREPLGNVETPETSWKLVLHGGCSRAKI